MRCVPEQKKRILLDLIVAVLIVVCVAAFAVYRLWDGGRIWCLLCGTFSLIAALYICTRYRIVGYVYVIRLRGDDDATGLAASYVSFRDVPYNMLDLAVLRSYGRRDHVPQCVLPLDSLKEAAFVGRDCDAKRTLREKYKAENGGRFVIYDYTLTPWTDDAVMLVFEDGEEYIGVLIEADEQMRGFFEVIG